MRINIYEAKSRLSALIDMVHQGKEVVIARAGRPVARIVPVAGPGTRSGVRLGGLNASRLKLSPDFHQPISDSDLLGK
jgi:prevent-host-death family protein